MKHSILVRATASTAVALATLTLTPAAQADVLVTNPVITADYDVYGYNGCTSSNPGQSASEPQRLDGAPVTKAVSGSSNVDDPQGPRTAVTNDVTGTGTASLRGGQLARLNLKGTGSMSLKADAGQSCGTGSYAQVEQELIFTLEEPQWLTVTMTTTGKTDAWFYVSSFDSNYEVSLYSDSLGGTSTDVRLLPAGTYELDQGVGWGTFTSGGQLDLVKQGVGTVSVRLDDAGSAIAAPAGQGKRYVGLGAQVSCSGPSLPARFTSTAGRVRAASFVVNGTVVKRVRTPKAGQQIAVPIPRFDGSSVKVVLVIDPPGDVRSAKVSVSRSYRACAAR